MEIELPFNHIAAAKVDGDVIGRAIDESAAHPVFRVVDLRAV
jgi:hypothetical protein